MKIALIGLLLFVFIEVYAFLGVKQLIKSKRGLIYYIIGSIILLGVILYGFSTFSREKDSNYASMVSSSLILIFYLPKLIIALFTFIEDMLRLLIGGFRAVVQYFKGQNFQGNFIPSRRKFISQLALGIAAIPFISVLHGVLVGRFKYTIYKTILEFEDLPVAFDGFTITQISDIHCGSFDNEEKLNYAIDLVNEQQSDLLLFTGDLVNSRASEMDRWYSNLGRLKAHPYGNYSVLGNHDYGTYSKWPTKEQEQENFEAICTGNSKIGFTLLRNENRVITKDGESIFIVGSENWGARMKFMKYGDLDKSLDGVNAEDFKILMSHDPSHWEAQVLDHPKNIQLTLSGHTHGSQFGIDIPGFLKWSPVQYVYKQWAGLYEKLGKYLYVNRGFGYHAYMGRTGIWPEITVIEIRRKK
ncbi:metallophosphoesterase [Myroides sp. LJL116]